MPEFKVQEEYQQQRVDAFLAHQLPQLSRAFIGKLCDGSKVRVNGKVKKASYTVRTGDKVNLSFDPAHHQPAAIELPILYEDDEVLVLNKPAGVLTHSKGAFNPEGTVATFIQSKLKDLKGERAGIVHRLDRATSGVIITAKTPEAVSWLQKQFSNRKVKKTYLALVAGQLQPPQAMIDMPIERHPKHPQTFRVGNSGKPSLTEYKVLEVSKNRSLLELKPQTGRTHQLRVHLKHLGHPILGDTLYAGSAADRLYLHAKSLELTLPNKSRQTFSVPAPESFKTKLDETDS